MIRASATQLRANLFSFLKQVEAGEVVIICLHGKEVGRLVSASTETPQKNWRDKLSGNIELLADEGSAFEPMIDLWEGKL